MVEKLVRYPDERIKNVSADVRKFDEGLFSLLTNMKDAMQAHGIKELSAIELGYPASVVVIQQDDGTYFELINPRVISMQEALLVEEETGYYPGIKATLTRYKKINVIYQDKEGVQHALVCEDDLAFRIQKQVDYTFGGTFMDKLPKKERLRLEKEIASTLGATTSTNCPTRFYRDYFSKALRYMGYLLLPALFIPLFINDTNLLKEIYHYELGGVALMLGLIILYAVVAWYEAKNYSTCTSCQSGNIIGTVLIALVKAVLITVVAIVLF